VATAATQRTRQAAAQHPDAVEAAARAGLIARGVLWALVALLALRVAERGGTQPGQQVSKQGAVATVVRQPLGRALLLALLLGFLAYAAFGAFEAVRGGKTGHRLAAAGRCVVYLSLAVTTVPVVLHGSQGADPGGATSGGGGQKAAQVLGWPGGRFLVGAVALAFLAAAVANVVRAVKGKDEEHWDRSKLPGRWTTAARSIEAAGAVGHGVAFALVGWFLLRAAWRYDANQPKGLDESLAALVHRPYGRWLVALVALGVACYALASFGQARWRRVDA
jgi:hypothetical protein